jgi:hypothetical protein
MSAPNLSQLAWRKSSHSNGAGGECVEVASLRSGVAVRDSKGPTGPVLTFALSLWDAFLHDVKAGQHDLP